MGRKQKAGAVADANRQSAPGSSPGLQSAIGLSFDADFEKQILQGGHIKMALNSAERLNHFHNYKTHCHLNQTPSLGGGWVGLYANRQSAPGSSPGLQSAIGLAFDADFEKQILQGGHIIISVVADGSGRWQWQWQFLLVEF